MRTTGTHLQKPEFTDTPHAAPFTLINRLRTGARLASSFYGFVPTTHLLTPCHFLTTCHNIHNITAFLLTMCHEILEIAAFLFSMCWRKAYKLQHVLHDVSSDPLKYSLSPQYLSSNPRTSCFFIFHVEKSLEITACSSPYCIITFTLQHL